MKIEYKFVTGTVEVEVPDVWGTVLVDLDRQEYNNDHKETRRHCSLEAYNLDDALLPSEEFSARKLKGITELKLKEKIVKEVGAAWRKDISSPWSTPLWASPRIG